MYLTALFALFFQWATAFCVALNQYVVAQLTLCWRWDFVCKQMISMLYKICYRATVLCTALFGYSLFFFRLCSLFQPQITAGFWLSLADTWQCDTWPFWGSAYSYLWFAIAAQVKAPVAWIAAFAEGIILQSFSTAEGLWAAYRPLFYCFEQWQPFRAQAGIVWLVFATALEFRRQPNVNIYYVYIFIRNYLLSQCQVRLFYGQDYVGVFTYFYNTYGFVAQVVDFLRDVAGIIGLQFVSFRETFKDIPEAQIGNADSIPNRVQLVGSLDLNVRVILQTLGLTVYHGGKFPKSKKTLGFEFSVLNSSIPSVCEGVSPEHLAQCHSTHQTQAGLMAALGRFFVAYALFVQRVIQHLVIAKGGSKSRPNETAYYARADGLFARRKRRSATSSSFNLTGRAYLAYKAGRGSVSSGDSQAEKPSEATRDGPSSPKASGAGSRKGSSKDGSSGVSQKDSSFFYSLFNFFTYLNCLPTQQGALLAMLAGLWHLGVSTVA